ncbi:hypothetical protein B0H10DRAFT_1947283 [Mycena sp. CBHHK59/15]|nr:hypothetical protein B0H10DRAFT_1947283 [Mycena sp. CBHHK59/15]
MTLPFPPPIVSQSAFDSAWPTPTPKTTVPSSTSATPDASSTQPLSHLHDIVNKSSTASTAKPPTAITPSHSQPSAPAARVAAPQSCKGKGRAVNPPSLLTPAPTPATMAPRQWPPNYRRAAPSVSDAASMPPPPTIRVRPHPQYAPSSVQHQGIGRHASQPTRNLRSGAVYPTGAPFMPTPADTPLQGFAGLVQQQFSARETSGGTQDQAMNRQRQNPAQAHQQALAQPQQGGVQPVSARGVVALGSSRKRKNDHDAASASHQKRPRKDKIPGTLEFDLAFQPIGKGQAASVVKRAAAARKNAAASSPMQPVASSSRQRLPGPSGSLIMVPGGPSYPGMLLNGGATFYPPQQRQQMRPIQRYGPQLPGEYLNSQSRSEGQRVRGQPLRRTPEEDMQRLRKASPYLCPLSSWPPTHIPITYVPPTGPLPVHIGTLVYGIRNRPLQSLPPGVNLVVSITPPEAVGKIIKSEGQNPYGNWLVDIRNWDLWLLRIIDPESVKKSVEQAQAESALTSSSAPEPAKPDARASAFDLAPPVPQTEEEWNELAMAMEGIEPISDSASLLTAVPNLPVIDQTQGQQQSDSPSSTILPPTPASAVIDGQPSPAVAHSASSRPAVISPETASNGTPASSLARMIDEDEFMNMFDFDAFCTTSNA